VNSKRLTAVFVNFCAKPYMDAVLLRWKLKALSRLWNGQNNAEARIYGLFIQQTAW